MKFSVLQENLVKSLSLGSRFVANKPMTPILSNLLIDAGKEGISVFATNMETSVKVGMRASVEGEGRVCVPAKLLSEYVHSLPAGKMEVEVGEDKLKLTSGPHKASLATVSPEDYPSLPDLKLTDGMEVKLVDLEKVGRLVAFSASNDETRPVLAALLIEVDKKGKMSVVATDGYRLSKGTGIEVVGGKEMKVLLSAKVLEDMVKLAKDEKVETIKIFWVDSQKSLAFEFGSVRVVSRLLEGDFPAYQKILPKSTEVVIGIGRDELLEAVGAAAVFARESSNIVKWSIEEKELVISANSSQFGGQESKVAIERKEGDGSKVIAFNSRFLQEWLSAIEAKEVIFSMNESLQPGLFTTNDKNFMHVIMPVRTQETS